MRFTTAIATSLVGAGFASAQQSYAGLTKPLAKDPDQVAANFPDVDVELLSPAFLYPDGVPKAFSNGTSGPTSQPALGKLTHQDSFLGDDALLAASGATANLAM